LQQELSELSIVHTGPAVEVPTYGVCSSDDRRIDRAPLACCKWLRLHSAALMQQCPAQDGMADRRALLSTTSISSIASMSNVQFVEDSAFCTTAAKVRRLDSRLMPAALRPSCTFRAYIRAVASPRSHRLLSGQQRPRLG